MKDGVQLGISGADEDCNVLAVGGRRTDWRVDNQLRAQDEMECAKRFCANVEPQFTQFEKVQQDSEVDVLAQSSDKKNVRKFQVTSIWPQNFWSELAAGATDNRIFFGTFLKLLSEAVQNKHAKRPSSHDVTLLLDPHPAAIEARCLKKLQADQSALQAIAGNPGIFLEIWLVDQNGCVKISP